ncbi:hypothetical protein QLQ15_01345 [Lysobacter sp. LF1]|uniref:Lipoprotein n=1 Tax=Lysobacter stagni TaxID=3045172 RepID=A0ABT6XBN3_9GAMM|nr:hypothetical protein [Lysobacter sp. LF1]MDI9237552.1 hypothetical protein [Lysobacter sp. LF1]
MRAIALALLLTASLTGCSGIAYKAAMPNVSMNCVDSLQAVSGMPLKFPVPGEELDEHEGFVEFASVARCYRPAEGTPVPVALYRLESITPPAEVKVSVQLSTGGTFAAALDVLDADMKPLRRYGFEQFTRRGSTYSLDVFLNPSTTTPAYVMLSPDQTHVGKKDTATGSATNVSPILAGPVMFMYHTGSETVTENPLLQGGKVRVVAHPHRTAITAD